MTRRSVLAVTTSRADYGHLYWPLRELEDAPEIDLGLAVTAAHLSPEFGTTVREIERDGFRIDARVECLMSSDTDTGMAKTIGTATLGFADALDRLRPDLVLLVADRYEMLAPASVALALRIPIAHVEGGDVSLGAIDDTVRNALTKMAHIHFAPTRLAARRLAAMGEEPWRIHVSGAPSLDHLRRSRLPDDGELAAALGGPMPEKAAVVAYHPVTLAEDTLEEADAVFEALERLERPLVFCFPNADAGSRALIERARALRDARLDASLHVNLRSVDYWGLLTRAAVLVGNSSSGIMESASLRLPTVDVGRRQEGRERARNVVDCPAQADAIVAAVAHATSDAHRRTLEDLENPYGDGRAAQRIRDVLVRTPIDRALLIKRPATVAEDGA